MINMYIYITATKQRRFKHQRNISLQLVAHTNASILPVCSADLQCRCMKVPIQQVFFSYDSNMATAAICEDLRKHLQASVSDYM